MAAQDIKSKAELEEWINKIVPGGGLVIIISIFLNENGHFGYKFVNLGSLPPSLTKELVEMESISAIAKEIEAGLAREARVKAENPATEGNKTLH